MTIFTLQSVKKDFGIKEILKDGSFSLDAADKVGLIGMNGSGKSTLLKMIAGLEPIDGGQILLNPGVTTIYLPQQPEMDPSHTVLEQVFASSGEQMQLVRDYEEISDKLAHPDLGDSTALLAKLSTVMQRMDATNAWELETKSKIILTKLGIHDFDAKVGDLSGGYRKRIALAAALLSEPDALLMDEPTNHLDAMSVEWLQEYLSRYRGAILLITHDRYFLDKVTNRIIEIDRGDIYTYSGNYTYYLEKKALAEESMVGTQRKHAGLLRRELAWLQRGAKARSTKQKARIGRAEDLKEKEFKQTTGRVDISTPTRRIGKKVIEVVGVSKKYEDRQIISDFTYEFSPEDRIGIIGENGAGKSTLMDICTGRLAPDKGSVDIGTTIHIGYFDQHSEDLQEAGTEQLRAIDYIKEVGEYVKVADGTQITASQMLERFLFTPNQQYTPISKLSGGEKRRLFLLRVLMSMPNVLILDEPTNDLDVQTLGVLEEYLSEFNGCVIVVSHDRYFLDRTVEKIFAIESEGKIREYPGNYSVYLEYKQAEANAEKLAAKNQLNTKKVTPTVAAPEPPKPDTQKRKLSTWEQREFTKLEAQIAKLETDKTKLEQKLAHSPNAAYSELQKITAELDRVNKSIDTTSERWLELAELA
ncbi:ABC-F family ATP-binding cassette domain-containing protein [Chamaesiphon sp. GL140_3_metabinner_50]|uniref:ABC-F family ATP-binding cassette domain-containing protein n=1 Tax=Chamaesiphon sp. GL140_3_metabinner_50 TaxID=2970812 RepID=UPI0025CE3FE1|nr:ABC-F family ATP-binding cassette domain-containing protein [Chamaesiphon sp. GL140_3_metabinner_50]